MSTTTTEIFRTPDERFEGLPGYDFAPHYAEIDGLRLHYVDEGPREGTPIVCFHGEPTWAYLYRKMLPPLVAAGHRVICPDYAGFGRSDKPTDRRWYSYDGHVELMTALLDRLELRGATVVVQDWGGPIGLRWAVEHEERVERLVVLNTGIFTGRVSKGFLAWRDFAQKNPDLPVGFVLQGATKSELAPEVVAAYEAPFPSPESKARPSSRCWCPPRRTVPAHRRCAMSLTRSRAGRSRRSSRSLTPIPSSRTPSPARSSAIASPARGPR